MLTKDTANSELIEALNSGIRTINLAHGITEEDARRTIQQVLMQYSLETTGQIDMPRIEDLVFKSNNSE